MEIMYMSYEGFDIYNQNFHFWNNYFKVIFEKKKDMSHGFWNISFFRVVGND